MTSHMLNETLAPRISFSTFFAYIRIFLFFILCKGYEVHCHDEHIQMIFCDCVWENVRECILWCALRQLFRINRLPHVIHWNGLFAGSSSGKVLIIGLLFLTFNWCNCVTNSPARCILLWSSKSLLYWNSFLHSLHLYACSNPWLSFDFLDFFLLMFRSSWAWDLSKFSFLVVTSESSSSSELSEFSRSESSSKSS